MALKKPPRKVENMRPNEGNIAFFFVFLFFFGFFSASFGGFLSKPRHAVRTNQDMKTRTPKVVPLSLMYS